jgi:hypothetical protein
VCPAVKPVGEPDAGDRHVRFDERGWETGRCRMAQVTAPILDLYEVAVVKGGISVVFSDLDSLWLRMWARGQAPQPRSGAPKAQGLRVRPHP